MLHGARENGKAAGRGLVQGIRVEDENEDRLGASLVRLVEELEEEEVRAHPTFA